MLVVAILLCLSAVSFTVSADKCSDAGGTCVDICQPGNGNACSKGSLRPGLCPGSHTNRCCLLDKLPPPPVIVPGPTKNCLYCICKAMSCKKGCVANVCGPFRISWPYWADCGKPGSSYRSCANNKSCARKCVKAYMRRYASGVQTCERYARVHKSGPGAWWDGAATSTWKKVKRCCDRKGGC